MSKEIDKFVVNGIPIFNIKNHSNIFYFGIASWTGSNYEIPSLAGVAHYAEHMFFKATNKRDYHTISKDFANIGAEYNAYTGNDEVVYFAHAPKYNYESLIEIITDLFFNSSIPEDELEKERNVILEEKNMYDDDPKMSFNNYIGSNMFFWHIGHDTIGTNETIKAIKRRDIKNYLDEKTNLSNFIIIACGNIDTSSIKKSLSRYIPNKHAFIKKGRRNTLDENIWSEVVKKPGKIKLLLEKENINQSDVQMLINGIPLDDKYYYDYLVLNRIIGGGSYSNLNNRIREQLGLCYSVGSYIQYLSYPSKSILGISGYTSPSNVGIFIDECEKVLNDIKKNGVEKDLLKCAKTDMISDVIRRTETSMGLASFYIKKLFFDDIITVDSVIDKINSVNLKSCNKVAEKLLNQSYNWAVMKPRK